MVSLSDLVAFPITFGGRPVKFGGFPNKVGEFLITFGDFATKVGEFLIRFGNAVINAGFYCLVRSLHHVSPTSEVFLDPLSECEELRCSYLWQEPLLWRAPCARPMAEPARRHHYFSLSLSLSFSLSLSACVSA